MEVILADYLAFAMASSAPSRLPGRMLLLTGLPVRSAPSSTTRRWLTGCAAKASARWTASRKWRRDCHHPLARRGPRGLRRGEARGLEVVDATCPHVKKAQLSAKELVDEGTVWSSSERRNIRRSRASLNGLLERHRSSRQRMKQRPSSPAANSASCARRRFPERDSVRLSCAFLRSRGTSGSCEPSVRRQISDRPLP